jgi:superfamily II DNA or RNA helicase
MASVNTKKKSIMNDNDSDTLSSETESENVASTSSSSPYEQDIIKTMKIDHSYPSTDDPLFQYKINKKREFASHRYPEREKTNDYKSIKEYRDKICGSKFALYEYQALLRNFLNPDTHYTGLLAFHGTGTGKTCGAITVAEAFKPMVQKYNTKIYVLVPGPLIKENWRSSLLSCTGNEYLKEIDKTVFQDEIEKQRIEKNAINNALQYYKFMSYRSFYKKVLGEKIIEKVKGEDDKLKKTFRKTKEGEFERELAVDRIYHLNNTLIIIDEAHRLTGNAYGDALMKIIRNSVNLKVLLLTATPMKNLADDIVELLNFIRPADDPVERDKIFTSNKNHLMELKPGGLEYLQDKARGYVSYLRGADPLTFAKRVEMGEIPESLLFTKVIRCKMLPFQKEAYEAASILVNDSLDRKSEAVANFAFPKLSENKKTIEAAYGPEGINIVRQQLKLNSELLNKKILSTLFNDETSQTEMIYYSDVTKTITGNIMKAKYLKNFSTKFYRALKNINELVAGKKGARTSFVYSNLVKVGIEIFKEVLLQNGYLEYDENSSNYKISNDTICYYCGKDNMYHKQNKTDDDIKNHEYFPATFISFTGGSSEENVDAISEDKKRILDDVFNNIRNKNGKDIKVVLGSKVMTEGISLYNIAEIHILDVYYNFGAVDQVAGRGIRSCRHYGLITDTYRYPEVLIYKYVVSIDSGLSTEEELYKKAELKYLLIKRVERAIKEVAIDCPLNRSGNIFPEELEEFKDCIEPGKPNPTNRVVCPQICDYTSCNFKCKDPILNEKYFDPVTNNYRKLEKKDIDSSTFSHVLAHNEIESAKEKIKEMYRVGYVYTLDDIIKYVKGSLDADKKLLFDDFFVFKALDELVPVTENDFNNFQDIVFDKFNKSGYIIHVDKYYIFQPIGQAENIPMYYRATFNKNIYNNLSLYDYLKNTKNLIKDKGKKGEDLDDEILPSIKPYTFQDDYYDSKEEFKVIGVIDKETARKKGKNEIAVSDNDAFKIRERRAKILEKKRGVGIPNVYGAVCTTAKDKGYLKTVAKQLDIKLANKLTKNILCDEIRNKLLFMEKYATGKDKLTYIMIPKDHPIYPFPYNLEDRVDYYKKILADQIKFKVNVNVKKNTKTEDTYGTKVTTYVMEIDHNSNLDSFTNLLTETLHAVKKGNKWIINID